MCNKLHTASVCSELDVWLTPRGKCRLSLLVWRRYVLEPSTHKNPAYSLSFHSPNKGKLVSKSQKHILTIFKVRTETSAWYQNLIPSSLVCTRQCQSSKQEPKLIVRPDYQLNSHTYTLNMTSGLPKLSKKQALSLLTRTWLIKLIQQLSMESMCRDLWGRGDWLTQSAVFGTTTTVHCMEQDWLNSYAFTDWDHVTLLQKCEGGDADSKVQSVI